MQQFDAYEAMASSAINEIFGEQVLLEPRVIGEFSVAQSVDPDRPATMVTAVVDFNPHVLQNRRSGKEAGDISDLIGESIHVSIRDIHRPYELRTGDRIVLSTRAGSPAVLIATSESDGIGRTLYRCKPTR